MQSPFYFIVKPMNGKRYDNTKNIGGIDFIVSTSEEDHKFSNRFAEVVEVPLGYKGPIQQGDTLLVHHNAFKFYNDVKGRQKSGKSFFKDDIFFIETDQFFMYKQGSTWNSYDKYCFVKPIAAVDSYINSNNLKKFLFITPKNWNEKCNELIKACKTSRVTERRLKPARPTRFQLATNIY
jgi:hypothetical protein